MFFERKQASRKTIGQLGEEVAEKFLLDNNYSILERNFQNTSGRRLGEIDIIAKDKTANELVFVEVKTRDLKKYLHTLPEENITYAKLRKMQRIAQDYLRKRNLLSASYRFDAISVWLDEENNQHQIKHLPNIFL